MRRTGFPVTASQANATQSKYAELVDVPGFADTFLQRGEVPATGSRFTQPRLATTLTRMTVEGLDSFYRGPLASLIAEELAELGLPVTAADLAAHRATRTKPLRLEHQAGEIFNLAPPTQGLVSLAILGITDRLSMANASEVQTIHRIVEATKKPLRCATRISPTRARSLPQYKTC
ncbi:Putative gamma-glutamyltransferase ywrD [Cedecea neteri]|uniref:Gamma-glutamyltransferase ywrD n=1 Tax=Cedecea neteri TaxID=158822 RepID=A0A2X2V6J5_9ENTR|nr:Putative gamma-glutamyltransferase ywrD [Cedecea neteri]